MDPQSHLLSILESHHSSLGPDDVNWAFTNPKSAGPVANYSEKYLTPDTLLSFEEAAIAAQLRKTGNDKKLARSHPTPTAPPLLPSRLSHESAHLSSAASTLETHTAHLNSQKAILDSLRTRNRSERDRRRRLDTQRARKWAAEREELQAVVDDLAGILNEEAADLRGSVIDVEKDVEEIQTMLERDDRWLGRLEKLAEGVIMPESATNGDGELQGEVKEVERLCETLARLEAEAVRKRLDRVYLEALERAELEERNGTDMDMDMDETVDDLKMQIEGLHQEITAVCKGATYNEFLQPVLAQQEIERQKRGENWVVGGEYIQHILMHLTTRNDAITTRLAESQSRDQAVMTVLSSISAELATMAPSSTTSASTPPSPPAQSADEKEAPSTPPPFSLNRRSVPRFGNPVTPIALSPNKRFQLSHRRRQSDTLSKSANPDQALLSLLGIALPAGPHVVQMARKINEAEWEMGEWDHAEAQAWVEMQKGKERLFGEGRWPITRKEAEEAGGALVLVREEVREELDATEKGIGMMAKGMAKSVKDVEKVGERMGKKKEEFVGRWGR